MLGLFILCLMKNELSDAQAIDFAQVRLDYARFKQLANNPHLSARERIGFPEQYRHDFESAIVADITAKFQGFPTKSGSLLDIGCGASPLTTALLACFSEHQLQVTLNDSAEMLHHISAPVNKIPGRFPDCLAAIQQANPDGFDYILCYSVFHYIYQELNSFVFLEALLHLLKPGGIAIIGDIPNESKRKRFFASEAGVRYHQAFMQTKAEPQVDWHSIPGDKIDDTVLQALVARAQACRCDAYLVPQGRDLPMHNRRDDLIIMRP